MRRFFGKRPLLLGTLCFLLFTCCSVAGALAVRYWYLVSQVTVACEPATLPPLGPGEAVEVAIQSTPAGITTSELSWGEPHGLRIVAATPAFLRVTRDGEVADGTRVPLRYRGRQAGELVFASAANLTEKPVTELVTQPEPPAPAPVASVVTEEAEAPAQPSPPNFTGAWKGTWQDKRRRLLQFTLYVNHTAAGARAVGTVENWTCWEVFAGEATASGLHLRGQDVVRNTRAKNVYVLDELHLTLAGKELRGSWSDPEDDSGQIRLSGPEPLPSPLWCAETLGLGGASEDLSLNGLEIRIFYDEGGRGEADALRLALLNAGGRVRLPASAEGLNLEPGTLRYFQAEQDAQAERVAAVARPVVALELEKVQLEQNARHMVIRVN